MKRINMAIIILVCVSVFFVTGAAFAGDWQTSGDDIYYDSGNVGIGTSSPSAELEVYKSGDADIIINGTGSAKLFLRTGGTADVNGIYFGDSGDADIGGIAYVHNTDKMNFATNAATRMVIDLSGNVGIGTTSPQSKLAVNGTITSKEVKVTETGWSDYVFDDSYNLPSLNHVESYIKENKHLPDIPSAKEVEEEGLSMADMMAKQMQKIEELTLYLIEMKKENTELKDKLSQISKRLQEIESH